MIHGRKYGLRVDKFGTAENFGLVGCSMDGEYLQSLFVDPVEWSEFAEMGDCVAGEAEAGGTSKGVGQERWASKDHCTARLDIN
jgi:hypothetical protein